MGYHCISEILLFSFASIGHWICNFVKEYKSKTKIMEAISSIYKSSREESKKAKDKTNKGSSKNTESSDAELVNAYISQVTTSNSWVVYIVWRNYAGIFKGC